MNWIPTWAEVGAGANALAIVGGVIATLVLGSYWWDIARARDAENRRLAYLYAVWTCAVALLAVRSMWWQPVYMARAAGRPEWAIWFVENSHIAAILTGAMGFVAALKLRFTLSRVAGAWWFAIIVCSAAVIFAIAAYLPRIL